MQSSLNLFFILLLCSTTVHAMNPEPSRLNDKELHARARELFEALNTHQGLSYADQIVEKHVSAIPNMQDKHYLLQYGLKWATKQKRFDLAKLYIIFGADQNESCFYPGETSLLGSITGRVDRQPSSYKAKDAEEQVAFLLEYGANPNPPDMLAYSPLDHQLLWFNHSHNSDTEVTFAACKMLFAHGTRTQMHLLSFHLTQDQRETFMHAQKEQEKKAKNQEQEMVIPLLDYYFLKKNKKSCAPLSHACKADSNTYDPAILFSFQEWRAQAMAWLLLPLPAPLVSLITAYAAETVPDNALLAVMIRKNQLLLAQQKAQDCGCGGRCIVQ